MTVTGRLSLCDRDGFETGTHWQAWSGSGSGAQGEWAPGCIAHRSALRAPVAGGACVTCCACLVGGPTPVPQHCCGSSGFLPGWQQSLFHHARRACWIIVIYPWSRSESWSGHEYVPGIASKIYLIEALINGFSSLQQCPSSYG